MTRCAVCRQFIVAAFTGWLTVVVSGAIAADAGLANDGAVQRLAEAVRFKTISYQDHSRIDYQPFLQLHDFLRTSYPQVYAQLDVEVVNDYSLMLVWSGSGGDDNPVLFTAHMDVVPIEPGTEGDWQHPPFSGVVADGKIHGRGTLDDKQGMMAWFEAVESLLAEGFRPSRTLVFAFGHDEEISGRNGAAKLAERMTERGLQFAWMIDEGGMILDGNPMLPDRTMAMINIAEKGYVTLTLVATGEGGHSSRPPKQSTIGRLAKAVARLEDNPFEPQLPAPVSAMLEGMAPHMDQPERFIFDNLWLTGSMVAAQMAEDRLTNSFVRTTTALTMFNAGVKENVVPQRAEAKVNFRLLPGDTPEQLLERVTALIDDPLIEIELGEWDKLPGVADIEGEGFTVISTATSDVYPEVLVVPSLLTATTDTRHYVDLARDQYRFHGVLMDSSQANSIHGTGEYIGVESYLKSIDIARRIIIASASGAAQ